MTPARYLIDKSALWRMEHLAVAARAKPLIDNGTVGVSILTELEVGFSARSTVHYEALRRETLDQLLPITLPVRAESRAREVQTELVRRGQHRAASIPDLLIAATAEIERLTMLHYDADFDLIAEITGQAVEWVVPRGSVP